MHCRAIRWICRDQWTFRYRSNHYVADTTSKLPSGDLSYVNDAANSGLITGAKIQLNAKSPRDLMIRSSSSSIAASAIADNIVVVPASVTQRAMK